MPAIGSAPNGQKSVLDGTEKLPISGSQYVTSQAIADLAGGGVAYASYYESTTHTIANNATGQTVEIDAEWVDASGLASVASNTITISAAGAGDYEIFLVVAVSAASPFNGHIAVYLNCTYTLVYEKKGYSTADGIQADYFYLHTYSRNVNTDTIVVTMDNKSGFTVTYIVNDITLVKLN